MKNLLTDKQTESLIKDFIHISLENNSISNSINKHSIIDLNENNIDEYEKMQIIAYFRKHDINKSSSYEDLLKKSNDIFKIHYKNSVRRTFSSFNKLSDFQYYVKTVKEFIDKDNQKNMSSHICELRLAHKECSFLNVNNCSFSLFYLAFTNELILSVNIPNFGFLNKEDPYNDLFVYEDKINPKEIANYIKQMDYSSTNLIEDTIKNLKYYFSDEFENINDFANYYCEKYGVETLNDVGNLEKEYNNYINNKKRVRER